MLIPRSLQNSLRLNPLLEKRIHLDQVGFVPHREARDNTLKTYSIIQQVKSSHTPCMLLSLDAEKAFDRVSWVFLRAVLQNIGLGPIMINKIFSLYHHPQAQISVNGSLSKSFEIWNGTRQGCPLSPLLHVLAMEHLMHAIRGNVDIMRATIRDFHFKCSAFADDLLLCISNPHISLPAVMSTLQEYSLFSNHKINWSKSVALNNNLDAAATSQLLMI